MLTLSQLGEFVERHHTRDLFRLETLPRYSAPSDGDDFHRYVRGEPGPTTAARQPWLDRLRADVARGRNWRKVHLVHDPVTDYERYECEWGFAYNVGVGEQIRIFASTPALDRVGDFFVLDHQHVVRSHYDSGFSFVGAEVVADSASFIAVAELLWEQARDFRSWWSENRQYHRSAGWVA